MKRIFKNISKNLIVITLILGIIFTYNMSITKLVAESYGDSNYNSIKMDIVNNLGFTINNVTVNGFPWVNGEDIFHDANNLYHIEIKISGNDNTENIVPRIQYGGNWNEYINSATFHEENEYTFILDVTDSEIQGFLGLEILAEEQQELPQDNGDLPLNPNNENEEETNEPHFDGKAYVVWSCDEGTCYHYFDDIPAFDDGNSKFYKDAEVIADNDSTKYFNVHAEYRGWVLKDDFERFVSAYKRINNVEVIDWNRVDSKSMIGDPPDMREWEDKAVSAGVCTRPPQNAPGDVREEFERCVDTYVEEQDDVLPFVKLQPVGEPSDNNAYVSYGDRNFKVVIYNSEYKGITIGNLSELHYYPEQWSNPFTRTDQYDISKTTKEHPTLLDSILLESTVLIRSLNYNNFEITSIEALDVPEDAVSITKENNEFKLIFSSNFYDNVVFKVRDNNNNISYIKIKRYTIDGYLRYVDNKPRITAEFYFDRNKSYSDFKLTAKIIYRDGSIKKVPLDILFGVDDGLGNISEVYEVDQQSCGGKGLKKSIFEYQLHEGEDRIISKIYINGEYTGSTETQYAGAYVGSGEGVLVNMGGEE